MAAFDYYGRLAGPIEVQWRTRRFTERANVAWTVCASIGQQRMRFQTVDVSPRGAELRPPGVVPVGSPLQLEFTKPDGARPPGYAPRRTLRASAAEKSGRYRA